MLNHKSTRSAWLFWLGALLGAAVFLLVYGLAPLDAANDAFCRLCFCFEFVILIWYVWIGAPIWAFI